MPKCFENFNIVCYGFVNLTFVGFDQLAKFSDEFGVSDGDFKMYEDAKSMSQADRDQIWGTLIARYKASVVEQSRENIAESLIMYRVQKKDK